jgi:hypothetical protein
VVGHDIVDLIEETSHAETPLEDLRRRGLEFVRYERADVRDGRSTVALGPGWAAWFADPATGAIGVLKYR